MHFASSLLLLMALVLAAAAEHQLDLPSSTLFKSRLARYVKQERGVNHIYKDMLLSNVFTHTYYDRNSTTLEHAISFHWEDPNSKSSTCCNASWVDSANGPSNYILCDTAAHVEVYQWYFDSYINGGQFTLQLAHLYQDAVNFPPPWDTPTFFSTTAVKLTCVSRQGLERCYLPANGTVVPAIITAISD